MKITKEQLYLLGFVDNPIGNDRYIYNCKQYNFTLKIFIVNEEWSVLENDKFNDKIETFTDIISAIKEECFNFGKEEVVNRMNEIFGNKQL